MLVASSTKDGMLWARIKNESRLPLQAVPAVLVCGMYAKIIETYSRKTQAFEIIRSTPRSIIAMAVCIAIRFAPWQSQ